MSTVLVVSSGDAPGMRQWKWKRRDNEPYILLLLCLLYFGLCPNFLSRYISSVRQMMTSWDNSNLVKIKFYFNFSINDQMAKVLSSANRSLSFFFSFSARFHSFVCTWHFHFISSSIKAVIIIHIIPLKTRKSFIISSKWLFLDLWIDLRKIIKNLKKLLWFMFELIYICFSSHTFFDMK